MTDTFDSEPREPKPGEPGYNLKKLFRFELRASAERAAKRAVALYEADRLTDEFRLNVLLEEIQEIETRMAGKDDGMGAEVRRRLRRIQEAESGGSVDGETSS